MWAAAESKSAAAPKTVECTHVARTNPLDQTEATIMTEKKRTHLAVRDSTTGEFVRKSEAKRRPSTTQTERVPNPGYGDTGRGKGGRKKC